MIIIAPDKWIDCLYVHKIICICVYFLLNLRENTDVFFFHVRKIIEEYM